MMNQVIFGPLLGGNIGRIHEACTPIMRHTATRPLSRLSDNRAEKLPDTGG
jgi:hypothetical protein